MSVMATNSMTSSGLVSGRVSALVSHMDEMTRDKLPNYVNIGAAKTIQSIKESDVDMSASSNSKFSEMGRVNAAFEDYDDDAAVVAHQPQLVNNGRSVDDFNRFDDDEHVYANFSEIMKHDEIEDVDRRPVPPTPTADMEPLRTMPTGWQEYKTRGGRSYYFHPEKKICQWKPPRNPKNFQLLSQCLQQQQKQLAQNHNYQQENERNRSAVGPSMSVEAIADVASPQHEYDTACCSSAPAGHDLFAGNGMTSFHSGMTHNFDRDVDQTKLMSQSVSGALLHRKSGSQRGYANSLSLGNNNITYFPPTLDYLPTETTNNNSSDLLGLSSFNGPTSDGTAGCGLDLTDPLRQFAHGQYSAVAVRQGTLEKCRLSDCGVKLKKREWMSAYAYLYTSHLLLYKDQKSAEKTGKHYPAPTDVCDLRGAVLFYADAEKRRKHIISLLLFNKTEYLFSCVNNNDSEINGWFHALRQTISNLPAFVQTYPLPVFNDYGGSLQRGSVKNKTLGAVKTGSFGSRSMTKSKLRKSSSKESVEGDVSKQAGEQSNSLTRESIIDRLLRFFRQRPSMESLRERGIYKPEPVFGSTLTAICTHEKTMVPRFISEVTRLIEERGLEMDGLYRVNGNLSSVQKIRCQIDQDKYEALQTEEDVHVLTGSLKLFFRELSEPLFPTVMNREFMSAIREPSMRQRFKAVDDLLLRLPDVNRETLKVLLCHLERVATYSGKNRMQIHNLAIMFGPTLFGTEDRAVTVRKNSADTKGGRNGRRKSADRKDDGGQAAAAAAEPNQNLAYKMVIYGQIIEFVLNEARKFSMFIPNPTSC